MPKIAPYIIGLALAVAASVSARTWLSEANTPTGAQRRATQQQLLMECLRGLDSGATIDRLAREWRGNSLSAAELKSALRDLEVELAVQTQLPLVRTALAKSGRGPVESRCLGSLSRRVAHLSWTAKKQGLEKGDYLLPPPGVTVPLKCFENHEGKPRLLVHFLSLNHRPIYFVASNTKSPELIEALDALQLLSPPSSPKKPQ